jgi:hypothetical protein
MTEQLHPEQSQAKTGLILGIIGLVCCWVLAPFAWWMSRKEVLAIDAGRRPPENRGTAQTGKVLGIIGTIVLALSIPLGVVVAQNIDEIGANIEETFSPGDEANRNEEGEIIATGTISVYDLEIGDCGDWPADMEVYFTITVHPCDVAHDFEVYLVEEMLDGANAVFPGDAVIIDFAEQVCVAGYEDYVGVAWEDALELSSTYLHPSEETWSEGDREVTCTLFDIEDGVKLVGSKKDSG